MRHYNAHRQHGLLYFPGAEVMKNETLLWEHKEGLAFLQGMEYKNGSLVCLKSGHYYIYSKVYLRSSNCRDMNEKNLSVVHTICRRTSQYPKELILLTNSILYCNWKNSLWKQSSFLAGVVHLEKKDEVFIKVSQPQLVLRKDDTVSYFGTFMI
uniref:TNF superfamily member 14 n=1 Tax=Salvator merianae TaxID=96440 RepID=A0A8D0DUJ5_SALMN